MTWSVHACSVVERSRKVLNGAERWSDQAAGSAPRWMKSLPHSRRELELIVVARGVR
jgi:hypothetical protein